jgi:hypothetical protein
MELIMGELWVEGFNHITQRSKRQQKPNQKKIKKFDNNIIELSHVYLCVMEEKDPHSAESTVIVYTFANCVLGILVHKKQLSIINPVLVDKLSTSGLGLLTHC